MMDKTLIVQVSQGVTNSLYRNNLQATEELMRLLDSLSECSLIKAEDYIKVYDDNFFTFATWEELLKSEEECADGLMELECKEQIGKSIWRLPCGWYVQYV